MAEPIGSNPYEPRCGQRNGSMAYKPFKLRVASEGSIGAGFIERRETVGG